MNRLKKMLTASVLTMTVLSMTVVASPVKAATADGDLVRTNVKSTTGGYAVYYIKNGKRYLFPSEKAYRTWYVTSAGKADFSMVKVIPESEMYAIPFGGNVVYRPGTRLVTFFETGMYAVEPNGTLRAITEAQAQTLYGAGWANVVEDIDPSLRNNYSVGAPLEAGKYPVGTVLNPQGTSTLYYYDGANYRQFANEAALLANGFSTQFVVTTSMAITAGGTMISAVEDALSNVAQAATTGSGIVTGTGSGLTVALAADTPAAATYVRDTGAVVAQSVASFTKINFTASSDGDVVVSALKLTRDGISADTDLANIYLYDGNTRLAEHTSISNRVISFNNAAGLFTVTRGTTKTITVKADISAVNATVSGLVLGVNAATDVTAGTAVVSGSFPVKGNSMGVGTVADLGYVNIATVGAGNFPATINPGTTNQELFRFNMTANDQQMNVESIKLTIVGTISTADLTNLVLKDTTGVQIGSAITSMNSAKELVFDASTSPYTIASGQTKTLAVYGDVLNGSGRTFKFTIRKSADVVVKDAGYGVYTAPLYNSAAFTIIDPDGSGNGTSINNGTITSGIASDSPTGNVAAGATAVTLAKYNLKANGEDVKVNYLKVRVENSLNQSMKNGKLLWNGTQVGSTDTEVSDSSGAGNNEVTFTVNQILKAGETATITYVADTSRYDTGAAFSGTATAYLVASTTDATGQSSLANVSIAGVTGRTVTFSAGTLTAVRNLAFANMATANPTGVKGATNVKVGSMVITAGTGEGSYITQIVVRDSASHSAGNNFGDNFQNLKLMHGATQLGATQGTLAHAGNDNYTFSISPAVSLAAGQQMVVDVYADILTGATGYYTLGQVVGLDIVSVTGTGMVTSNATTVSGLTTNLQTLYIAANGNLTITADSTSPTAAQLVMGSTENTVAAFRFDAGTSSESINVSMITLSSGSDADVASYSNIKFYDGATLLGTVASFDGSQEVVLNLATNWVIPKGQAKVLTIKADVNTSDNTTAAAGAVAEVTLSISGNTKVTSIGAGSGQAITETVTSATGSEMTFVKTKLTVAASGNTPSGAAGKSTESTVAIFRFSNSSNVAGQQAKVTDLAINIATSGTWNQLADGSTTSLKVYKNSVTTGNLLGAGPLKAAPVSVAFGGWTVTNDSNPTATSLIDFTIASGSYIDIYVTVNTTNAPSLGTLTVSIPASNGVKWEDGVYTGADLVVVDTLPVTGGTLTY